MGHLLKLFGSIWIILIRVRVIFLGKLIICLLYLLLTRIPDNGANHIRKAQNIVLHAFLTWKHPAWNRSQVPEAYWKWRNSWQGNKVEVVKAGP